MPRVVRLLAAVVVWGVAGPVLAQSPPDVAMGFFTAGGAYCFRLAPEGVALNDETEWTIMVLAGTANRANTFRIRTVEPGRSGFHKADLLDIGMSIANVWRMDGTRREFFERFAAGIDGVMVRARVVKMTPPGLAAMTPRQRAEIYLKFSDKGGKVDFSGVHDLTSEEFASYAGYVPD